MQSKLPWILCAVLGLALIASIALLVRTTASARDARAEGLAEASTSALIATTDALEALRENRSFEATRNLELILDYASERLRAVPRPKTTVEIRALVSADAYREQAKRQRAR